MAPRGKLYTTLQDELIRLYMTEKEAKNTPKVKIGKVVLKPGATNKSVLSVRRRMGFDADANLDGHYYYDDALAQAVMAFQRAHGLKPDAIVGLMRLLASQTRWPRRRARYVSSSLSWSSARCTIR